jgi:NAD(P)H dehydrogenase (quinone)
MLAVTGATGRVGGRVARALASAGVEQRLVVRDISRAPQLENVEIVAASYGDGAAARRALEGVTTLFMVSAAEAADRMDQHRTFIDAAVASGVRQIVYTSFLAAAPDSTFTLGRDHWATEQHIRSSGVNFTFLRDSLYADFLPLMAGADGVIRGPAGDGRLAAVAIADVAAVATTILRAPEEHLDAAYDLTGPEALTLAEAASIVTSITGRAVSYHDETLDEAYASRAGYGAPDWQVEAWVSTYTAIAAGELERVSDDIPNLLGRPATSLAQLLREEIRT